MPAKCRSDVGTSPDPNMRHVTDPMSFIKEHPQITTYTQKIYYSKSTHNLLCVQYCLTY